MLSGFKLYPRWVPLTKIAALTCNPWLLFCNLPCSSVSSFTFFSTDVVFSSYRKKQYKIYHCGTPIIINYKNIPKIPVNWTLSRLSNKKG